MGDAYESITVDVKDNVAQVTLVGPGKGNAMGPAFWAEMPEVFAKLDADRDVRAIVLTGSGKHFSYGLDLPAMGGSLSGVLADGAGARPRADFHATILRMQGAINAVADCRTPTIASVHGWCIGGGVDLISAVDIRYASADAKFSVREVKLAIVADVGSLARLPLIINDGHLRELALTGKDIDAAPRREDRARQRRLRRPRCLACGRTRDGRRDRRQPAAGRQRRQGRARSAAHRQGLGEPALRRGVECGVPAVEGSGRGAEGDVREATAQLHRGIVGRRSSGEGRVASWGLPRKRWAHPREAQGESGSGNGGPAQFGLRFGVG